MRRSRQGELPLHRGTWGGWRPGAGRKPGPDPRVRHRSRAGLASRYPCHVTLKVREGMPSLRSFSVVRAVEASFRRGCERPGFRLTHYSIQGDHLHAIVEARTPETLGRGMKSLAARFARAVNRALGRRGRVLRDRYHHRVLRTPREVRSALAYVLLNARRHAAKGGRALAGAIRLDPASSARWFEGWRRDARLAAAPGPAGPAAVARPHTWLLLMGWRRRGLLDPAEVPGGSTEDVGVERALRRRTRDRGTSRLFP